VQILDRSARKARFVSEVALQLQTAHVSNDRLDQGLEELENAGRVLVREQFCGDPHLEGADLRIVALIKAPSEHGEVGGDPLASAVADIDSVWQRWLTEYLSNHRCG